MRLLKRKAKDHDQGSWLDGQRDASITELDVLRDIRLGIRNAVEDKNADAVKTLAEAHECIAGVRERKAGF